MATRHPKLIGLLGGSFDPIHLGHLYLAKTLLKKFPFKKIYFIPAKQNPLKKTAPLNSKARLNLLKVALKETGEKRLEILDWEIKRKKPSYTLLTVLQFKKKFGITPTVILGNEAFSQLPKWHRAKTLLKNANFIIISRDRKKKINAHKILKKTGISDAQYVHKNILEHSKKKRQVYYFFYKPLSFSSTDIRKDMVKIRKTFNRNKKLQRSPKGIQRSVWLLIKEKNYYAVSK